MALAEQLGRPARPEREAPNSASLHEDDAPQRMNIVLRPAVRAELDRIAADRGVTLAELIRQFIKLGILAARIEEKPGASLQIKDGDEVTRLQLL